MIQYYTSRNRTSQTYSVSGYVNVYLSGDPLPGVTMDLVDPNDNIVQTTTTDANGYYEFTDLPANADLTIVPSKSETFISAQDILDWGCRSLQRDAISAHLSANPAQSVFTGFENTSADADSNGVINTTDGQFIHFATSGNGTAIAAFNAKAWYICDPDTPTFVPPNEYIGLMWNGSGYDTNLDFIAVKKGAHVPHFKGTIIIRDDGTNVGLVNTLEVSPPNGIMTFWALNKTTNALVTDHSTADSNPARYEINGNSYASMEAIKDYLLTIVDTTASINIKAFI